MTKSYYCHITSWINSENKTYFYQKKPVSLIKYFENIDQIFENFLRGETSDGYSPKSERLYKVSEDVLKKFQQRVFHYEIDSSKTYDLDEVLSLADQVLVGYNTEMRYRRSIYFCEEIMAGIAKAEEFKIELKEYLQLIESNKEDCLALINENAPEDFGIFELGGVQSILRKTQKTMELCKGKLAKLVEQKEEILYKKAYNLEATLARAGYKAPILKFSID
ncbi:MAG: hypothetical protein CMP84_13415 [Gammaproteobacteria bacterium]|nr:hypothetical protein [Gammaproteobacteria bacterium]|tara:strand:- start:958 stop:1620 length:663 start_codon:yes stop_codon:yes gene_type:complete